MEQYLRDKIEIFIRLFLMNAFLAIFKVTDAKRDVILAGGLYHRFPLPPPPPTPLTPGLGQIFKVFNAVPGKLTKK